MTFLSEDDLEWVKNIPDSNHPVIFKSNKGNVDTIVYTDKWIQNDKKWYTFSENTNGIREANAGYDYSVINHRTPEYNENSFDGYFAIVKNYKTDSLYTSFSFNNISYSSHFNKVKLSPIKTIKLNQKKYINCFIIDSLNSVNAPSEYDRLRELKKFVICKGIGLVYYEYKDGEAFTIVD